MIERENTTELCRGGELLEARISDSLRNIESLLQDQKKGHEEAAYSIVELKLNLKEFTTRDFERLGSLEKSRECEKRKTKELTGDAQDLKIAFATHQGEHEAIKKLEGATGKRWGFLSATGTLTIFEFFRFLLTGKWG